jgi:hypothetical protein
MKEPDFTPNEPISAIPRRKVRRGRGLSIRQLLFWVMFFAVAFAILRVFEGHIEVLIGLLIAFLISVGFGLSVSLMQRRAGMQEAFIEMVAISRQTGLPLAVGLSSFAPQCGRSYSRSLVRLRSQIESGMSLSDGVAVTYGVLPLEQRVHFRVAEFNGSRAESMQRIARNRFLRIESLKPLYDSIIYSCRCLAGLYHHYVSQLFRLTQDAGNIQGFGCLPSANYRIFSQHYLRHSI